MTQRESLKDNLENLNRRIAEACRRSRRNLDEIRLVAVTKYIDARLARELAGLGVRNFGENRLQVAAPKLEALTDLPIRWHWIGTLQSNKVRRALESFTVFHSIDRLSLIEALERGLAEKYPGGMENKLPVYLQVNISGEVSKSGVSREETPRYVERLLESNTLECVGFMTMAPYSDDPENARPVFAALRELRDRVASEVGTGLPRLSMGMTDDFEVAVEEGATDLRIGRLLYDGLLG